MKPRNLIETGDKIIELQLAKGTFCMMTRIGYEDEGLRLTFFDKIPHNISFEIQLSKADATKLLTLLRIKLDKEIKRGLK